MGHDIFSLISGYRNVSIQTDSVNSIESVWCLIGRLVIDRLIDAVMLVYN